MAKFDNSPREGKHVEDKNLREGFCITKPTAYISQDLPSQ